MIPSQASALSLLAGPSGKVKRGYLRAGSLVPTTAELVIGPPSHRLNHGPSHRLNHGPSHRLNHGRSHRLNHWPSHRLRTWPIRRQPDPAGAWVQHGLRQVPAASTALQEP